MSTTLTAERRDRPLPAGAGSLPRRRGRRGRPPIGRSRSRRSLRARVAGQRRDLPHVAPLPRGPRHLPRDRPARRRIESLQQRHPADGGAARPERPARPRHHGDRRRRGRRTRQRRVDRPARRGGRSPGAGDGIDQHRAAARPQLALQVVPVGPARPGFWPRARLGDGTTVGAAQPVRARRRVRRRRPARRRVRRVLPPADPRLARAPGRCGAAAPELRRALRARAHRHPPPDHRPGAARLGRRRTPSSPSSGHGTWWARSPTRASK